LTTDRPAAKMPPLWVIKIRAPFFTADIVPVCVGTAVAWSRAGEFNLWLFLLTVFGTICINAGTNMTNDYFDHKWGSDEVNTEFANPFTGGSRLIQMGLVKPQTYMCQGLAFFVAAILIGLFLAFTRSQMILWIGIAGVFCGLFYTAPPFRLVRAFIGELAVGICLGPLTALGAYLVQTRTASWEAVFAGLPVMILISLVLWINEFQDASADAAVGKNHLVVRLGRRRAALVYGVLLAAVYLSLIAGVLFGGVTPFALLGLLTVPTAVRAYRIARVHYDHPQELVPANAATIQLHLRTGLLIALGYVIHGALSCLL